MGQIDLDKAEINSIRESFYDTVEFKMPTFDPPKLDRLTVIKAALDLVVEFWPKPGYATVTLETHQWVKLRQLLLAIPELVATDE